MSQDEVLYRLKVRMLFLCFVLALVLAFMSYQSANAQEHHEHGVNGIPTWYEPNCCSLNDCKPVEDNDIDFGLDEQGLPIAIYKPTGNAFPLRNLDGTRSYQHRNSQDERYHVCINPNTGASLCFYNKFGV